MSSAPARRPSLVKMTRSAILINSCQIACAAGVAAYALTATGFHLTGPVERALAGAMALVVAWGAALDIREAYSARRIARQRQMLEEAYAQLETLNATLRAQRHDFMNHVQVVYSLTELDDRAAALDYMDRVYGDLQRVGRALKTSVPAVNALIAAKMADCEEKGIRFVAEISSNWADLPVPGWEMCRVLGNLIDNAIDALLSRAGERVLRVALTENLREFCFAVENNGPPIPEALREEIFALGFSTKGADRGTGLSNVREVLAEFGGSIALDPEAQDTRFVGKIPKKRD